MRACVCGFFCSLLLLREHRYDRVIVTPLSLYARECGVKKNTNNKTNSLLGEELNICGPMAGMSSDGGDKTGMTGGEPINGDMAPNAVEAFPGCPAPFCRRRRAARQEKKKIKKKTVLTVPRPVLSSPSAGLFPASFPNEGVVEEETHFNAINFTLIYQKRF